MAFGPCFILLLNVMFRGRMTSFPGNNTVY
jgi:hypothetical protein